MSENGNGSASHQPEPSIQNPLGLSPMLIDLLNRRRITQPTCVSNEKVLVIPIQPNTSYLVMPFWELKQHLVAMLQVEINEAKQAQAAQVQKQLIVVPQLDVRSLDLGKKP